MNEQYQARIVIILKDEFAKAVNGEGLYADAPELDPSKQVLAEENATLANAMEDFRYYIQASDAHGAEPSPIIDGTRDATQSPQAQAYYDHKFVVSVASGIKVFDPDVAERIAAKLRELEGGGVVEEVRIDSMDPAKNPPIPEKYFGKTPPENTCAGGGNCGSCSLG